MLNIDLNSGKVQNSPLVRWSPDQEEKRIKKAKKLAKKKVKEDKDDLSDRPNVEVNYKVDNEVQEVSLLKLK